MMYRYHNFYRITITYIRFKPICSPPPATVLETETPGILKVGVRATGVHEEQMESQQPPKAETDDALQYAKSNQIDIAKNTEKSPST